MYSLRPAHIEWNQGIQPGQGTSPLHGSESPFNLNIHAVPGENRFRHGEKALGLTRNRITTFLLLAYCTAPTTPLLWCSAIFLAHFKMCLQNPLLFRMYFITSKIGEHEWRWELNFTVNLVTQMSAELFFSSAGQQGQEGSCSLYLW